MPVCEATLTFVNGRLAVAEQRNRRLPRQERSRQRFAAILDAAEQVIGQAGYEAATTEEIARRAGTSIGSFYRYFPDKAALLQVLVERYLDQLRTLFEGTLTAQAAQLPVDAVLDRLIDGLMDVKTAHPAFWPVLYGGSAREEPHPAVRDLHRELQARVASFFALRAPELTAEDCELYAGIAVPVVEVLLPLALESPDPHRGRVVAELKRLLFAYLDPVL